jgi:hypothetical protein
LKKVKAKGEGDVNAIALSSSLNRIINLDLILNLNLSLNLNLGR